MVFYSNIWSTSGTVTESGGKLNVYAGVGVTTNATADQTNAIDYKVNSYDKEVFVKAELQFGGAGGGTIKIYVGTTQILSYSRGSSGIEQKFFNIRFDDSANSVRVLMNGVDQGAVDITAEANWYLKFEAVGGGAGLVTSGGMVDITSVGTSAGTSALGAAVGVG